MYSIGGGYCRSLACLQPWYHLPLHPVDVTGGMLVYGRIAYPTTHWIAPTIGLAMVGFGTTAVIVGNTDYLVDAYSKYAASTLGAVSLVEDSFVAFLPPAASSMYRALVFQWASSLLAFLSLALVATPFLVLGMDKEIRSCSPFMKEAIIDSQ